MDFLCTKSTEFESQKEQIFVSYEYICLTLKMSDNDHENSPIKTHWFNKASESFVKAREQLEKRIMLIDNLIENSSPFEQGEIEAEIKEVTDLLIIDKIIDQLMDKTSNLQQIFQLQIPFGDPKLVEMLLDEPRVYPSIGNNLALDKAIVNNKPELVRVLLKRSSIDTMICPTVRMICEAILYNTKKSLSFAENKDSLNIIKQLFDHSLEDDRVDLSFIHVSVLKQIFLNGSNELVKIFLDHCLKYPKIDLSSFIGEFFRRIIRNNNLSKCKLLLDYSLIDPRIDPSFNDNEFIIYASRRGFTNLVKLLLDDKTGRVDPSARNNQALIYATSFYIKDIILLLLQDPRVDPTVIVDQLIICGIASEEFVSIIELLLNNPRLNSKFIWEISIRASITYNRIKIFKFLLKDSRFDREFIKTLKPIGDVCSSEIIDLIDSI